MEWTRSETLALASPKCARCLGIGMRKSREGVTFPCGCVLRTVFRACYGRFRQCVEKEKHLSQVTLGYSANGGRRITWGRKDEEFIADFYLVTRRTLTAAEWRIFSYHYLLGADWRLCTRRLKIDRGTFFHALYRLQARLGRVFRELAPYGLYPLDEYFFGRTLDEGGVKPCKVVPIRSKSLHETLKVAVRKAA